MSNHIITLAGIGNIHTDAEGRFSLNDCHAAAGNEDRHKPVNFLGLESTKGIIDILKVENPTFDPTNISKGRYGGSYACEEHRTMA